MHLCCVGWVTFGIEMVDIGPAIQKCGVVPILFGGRLEINRHTVIGIENAARNFFTLNMLIQFIYQLKNTAVLFAERIAISKYFLHHAKCVHNLLGADKDIQLAKNITKKLREQEKTELSKYQIYRLCRGSFRKVDDLNPILDILIEYGYLKERTHPTPTGGLPYLLNPNFFKNTK